MGNAIKRPCSACDSPMANKQQQQQPEQILALAAVAQMMHLTKQQVFEIQKSATTLAGKNGGGKVNRDIFDICLSRARVVDPIDVEILGLLFTMWDIEGEEEVPCDNFVIGISPLACPCDDLYTALSFAIIVADKSNAGKMSPEKLTDMLESINATASYFGDPGLGSRHIYQIVESIFDSTLVERELSCDVLRDGLLRHPLIKQFLARKCEPLVKFKDDLVEQRLFVKTSLDEDLRDLSSRSSSVFLSPVFGW